MRSIRNCNVCVVGGAGFLGSHLVNHLVEDRGCCVLVVDNLCVGRREFIHPKADFQHHDITGSEGFLRKLFQHHAIKYVFNYAAWPYVPTSFDRPLHVCDVNFMGAIKVINAAHEAGCEAILQVSSAEIYGDGNCGSGTTGDSYAGKAEDGTICGFKALNEHSPVIPHSSYGSSKAAVDSYVQCRWKERRVPCIALRQFNCVGERETHPYVIPEIIGQIEKWGTGPIKSAADFEREPTVRLGNNSFRDFLYAGDQARIAVELLERGEFGAVYNLGSETGIRIYDLAKLIGKVMGFTGVHVEEDEARKRPWEIWSLLSSNQKIYSIVDARPTVSLEEALRKTVESYRASGCKWCWEA